MEDATDFSWQGAKAAHAVLLCEMERGSLKWEDTDRVDRDRGGRMPKSTSLQENKIGLGLTKSPGFVRISKQTLVITKKIMRSMVDCIGTFVLFV